MDWKQWSMIAESGRPTTAQGWLPLLYSFSGFDRQAAVEALAERRHGPALPGLLRCVNDWVPQVREAARRSISPFFRDEFVEDWMRALPALRRLEGGRRASHEQLLRDVVGFLSQPSMLPRVRAAATEASPVVRRWLHALEWQAASGDVERQQRLVESGLVDADVRIAAQSLRALGRIDDAALRERLLRLACLSRFASVRADALRRWIAAGGVADDALLRSLCVDGSATVRGLAVNAARDLGVLPAVLREAQALVDDPMAPPRRAARALMLLAGEDPSGVLVRCEQWAMTAGAASLRRAALQILISRGDSEGRERWMLHALRDTSGQVQRVGGEAVRRGVPAPTPDELTAITRSNGHEAAWRRALSIQRRWGSWTRLIWLLERDPSEDPGLTASMRLDALHVWERDAGTSYQSPTPEQARRLGPLWRRCEPTLSRPLARLMAFHLESVGVRPMGLDETPT